MAIIVKPFTFFPGTVIRSSEVNSDFDTIYSDYNGNISNANIASGAGIEHSKLQTVGSAQILVGSGAGVLTPRTMSGDATISNTGVVTVTSAGGGSFTSGSIIFAGAAGVFSEDNLNLFWDNSNNRLGIGTNAPSYDLDINKSVAAATGVNGAIRNSDNASGVSHAIQRIQTGGAAGGDPFTQYNVNGVSFWSAGIDNSDNDNFKISANTQPGLGNGLTLNANGELLVSTVNPPTANYANTNSFVKGWVKSFVGAILDSFNVTSITFMGAGSGRWRITWTTPFANTNYVVTANASFPSAGNIVCMTSNVSTTQSDIYFYVGNTGAAYDASSFSVIAIGDQ